VGFAPIDHGQPLNSYENLRIMEKSCWATITIKKLQSIQDESKDPLVILKVVHYDGRNGGNEPFFISLVVNNLLLHNCMLDTRDSTIVMSLKDTDQLGLKITRPYRNVCGIDSKNIKVSVLTKDLKVSRHISLNGCCSYSCA
jgi:hypothetical protein